MVRSTSTLLLSGCGSPWDIPAWCSAEDERNIVVRSGYLKNGIRDHQMFWRTSEGREIPVHPFELLVSDRDCRLAARPDWLPEEIAFLAPFLPLSRLLVCYTKAQGSTRHLSIERLMDYELSGGGLKSKIEGGMDFRADQEKDWEDYKSTRAVEHDYSVPAAFAARCAASAPERASATPQLSPGLQQHNGPLTQDSLIHTGK